ncbi:NnrS family protein [Enterovirga rhinocerotis]|uniref:Uncharacterized protein involved in response to NO n=1 Tax=Enterovirga rhinocerotis TaxID=1339210 RepID=A0A4R7C6Q4_9HYPH|nr:NnrS family protein [Enterovirga rhinocerotis]TDR94078.1 uncharacterized protein involved in response to NO [Enterovirga rhinocerotis]
MAPIPRLRDYSGPAILSYGFRPFFLMGALQAALAMVLLLPLWFGWIDVPTAFAPRDWHVHELLYGYLPAVTTGFLLTAIPNWTGRMPLQGNPLLGLVLLWAAGRPAVAFSAVIGWQAAAAIDCAFLIGVVLVVAREVVTGRNWRNLPVLLLVTCFALGNVTFHIEAARHGTAETGIRIGLAVAILLVMLIGGRIIPSFTRNWLARRGEGRLPVPFGRFDIVSLAIGLAALAAWAAAPQSAWTAASLILAGCIQAVRLARWAGDRTLSDRLVLILHLGYVFVPIGFVLLGAGIWGLVPETAGIHAWTGGAIGAMTLAVMTRASLGHTGRDLVADRATEAVFGLVLVAAVARIGAALVPSAAWLLWIAGLAWVAAFAGFALAYGPILCRPRLSR